MTGVLYTREIFNFNMRCLQLTGEFGPYRFGGDWGAAPCGLLSHGCVGRRKGP